MRPNMFRRFFEDLLAGDPVALTVVGVLAGLILLFCLYWYKTVLNMRREDEERKQKRSGKVVSKRPKV